MNVNYVLINVLNRHIVQLFQVNKWEMQIIIGLSVHISLTIYLLDINLESL